MFGIVLTTAYTVMLVYVLWRTRSIPSLKHRFSRTGVIGIGAILWAVFFFARNLGHQKTGAVAGAIEFMGMVLLGTVFLISTAVYNRNKKSALSCTSCIFQNWLQQTMD